MLEPKVKRKIFVYGSLRTGFFNYEKYLKGKRELYIICLKKDILL